MKSEPGKSKKHRQFGGQKIKPVCGTLSYLAECRGTAQKTTPGQKEAPLVVADRIVRKNTAAF